MEMPTLSLAELITRGITSINENRNSTASALKYAPPGGGSASFNSAPERQHEDLSAPAFSDDVMRLRKSAENLVNKLSKLPNSAPDDTLPLRRHILHSVESFLQEIGSMR